MTRSTPFRFSPFKISLAIVAAIALLLSPQAFAQHGGGGGHASGGGGHFAGGGGHFSGGGSASRSAGFGASDRSFEGSRSSSPIHVFSGPRSAPARAGENAAAAATNERARASAIQPHSSDISVLSSSGMPRGLAAFADPNAPSSAAAAARARSDARPPMHTTIGFPSSTDPRLMSSPRGGAPLSFSGQGREVWQTSRPSDANIRNSVRAIESRPPQRVFPKPPHVSHRPILPHAPGLIGGPAFVFFSPIYGFYGPGFGCYPFWAPAFSCGSLYPWGFGGYSAYGGYAGGFDNSIYGYNGGDYYAPPSDFGVAPNGIDEGASQEPAPGPYENPPADNSSPDNSAADNSSEENSAPAPDTLIYLKDGTSFSVKDYWIAGGQLHYVTTYGGQNAVDLNQLDLERTTDANASRGVTITLRPAPDSQSQPRSAQPPNAQPPDPQR